MKYSIDYVEENRGFEIVESIEDFIKETKEEFRCGEISYSEMLYKIGEKMYIAGGALYSENRYADKEDTEDLWQEDPRIDEDFKNWLDR